LIQAWNFHGSASTSAETEKLKQRARDLGITLSPEDIKGLKNITNPSPR